jgi:hypothetical protein
MTPRILGGLCLAFTLLAAAPASAREEIPRGQITEEAARANALFRQKKWAPAAVALGAVAEGATGDHRIDRQIAEYRLAIALYRLQFYQASLERFRSVAARRGHVRRLATLGWLARLAHKLPEPAGVRSILRHYKASELKPKR